MITAVPPANSKKTIYCSGCRMFTCVDDKKAKAAHNKCRAPRDMTKFSYGFMPNDSEIDKYAVPDSVSQISFYAGSLATEENRETRRWAVLEGTGYKIQKTLPLNPGRVVFLTAGSTPVLSYELLFCATLKNVQEIRFPADGIWETSISCWNCGSMHENLARTDLRGTPSTTMSATGLSVRFAATCSTCHRENGFSLKTTCESYDSKGPHKKIIAMMTSVGWIPEKFKPSEMWRVFYSSTSGIQQENFCPVTAWASKDNPSLTKVATITGGKFEIRKESRTTFV